MATFGDLFHWFLLGKFKLIGCLSNGNLQEIPVRYVCFLKECKHWFLVKSILRKVILTALGRSAKENVKENLFYLKSGQKPIIVLILNKQKILNKEINHNKTNVSDEKQNFLTLFFEYSWGSEKKSSSLCLSSYLI